MGKCMSIQKNEASGTVRQHSIKTPKIQAGLGSKHQGAHELKLTYLIDEKHQRLIGSGAFGKVFLSNSIANPEFKVAIKVLDKQKMEYDLDLVASEIAILNKLDHLNIVKYFETYNDAKYIYLVMEFVEGMQIFKHVAQKKLNKGEQAMCGYMKQIVSAINYCHANNIIHRDIKPENVMVNNIGTVKILDFGLSMQAKIVKNGSLIGTPYYMAPEIIQGNAYDCQVDVWSMGVLLYQLVSGIMPFEADSQNELFEKIVKCKINFDHPEFKLVSENCKNLIKRMIVKDPSQRIKTTEILKHEWFVQFAEHKKVEEEVDMLDPEIFKKLKNYKSVSYFRKAAMNMLVKMSSEGELDKMSKQFKKLDKDETGMISVEEIQKYIKDNHLDMSDDDVKQMFKQLDYKGNNMINYTEFLAATLDTMTFFNESKLRSVFSMFDTQHTGAINAEEMKEAFEKLNQTVTTSEIQELIKLHCKPNSNKLTYDEFKNIFCSESPRKVSQSNDKN